MKLLIEIEEIAIKLSDEAISFNTENRVKKEIGMEWNKLDVRLTMEWQQWYHFYCHMLKIGSELTLVTNTRTYKQAEFVKEYMKKHGLSNVTVLKLIRTKTDNIKYK